MVFAARNSWEPGEEEDGGRGRQGGTLPGIQAGTRRGKKTSRKDGGKRGEAREGHTQERGEVEGYERECALGGKREGRFHGGE